jgi:UPF0755 protein
VPEPGSGEPPASSGTALEPPERTRGKSRGLLGLPRTHPVLTSLGVLASLCVGFFGWAASWYEGASSGQPGGSRAVVEVSPGSSVSGVVASLARRGVVDSSFAFRIYLAIHGAPVVQAGEYLLRKHEDFASVREALVGGPDVFELSVPPGFTVYETAERVGQIPGHDASHFRTLATSGAVHSQIQPPGSNNLDGLLGTGLYTVLPGESDTELLEQMVERFDTQAFSLGLVPGAASVNVTPYEAMIVASIVQKEGVYAQNLSKVARVIYNRLARDMPLQMDSTVLYAEHRDGGPVTSSDLDLDTPYNTYLYRGLTPTPICFPSPAAIKAALEPAPGDWLYFVVVSKDGTEAFSDTLAGQKANEALAKSRGLP